MESCDKIEPNFGFGIASVIGCVICEVRTYCMPITVRFVQKYSLLIDT